ncbi:thromboxane-A synthase isoform X2 [Rhinatrema bivittatum]|uniref:thromboxane-A synthase isoform X2 n=1 Tax=Rhinatrema bivittatum TaxID=194408 RepID=UPI00112CB392|nr:thromboxane-A synthase isoform X2 [Rhinatrema bivittatum]
MSCTESVFSACNCSDQTPGEIKAAQWLHLHIPKTVVVHRREMDLKLIGLEANAMLITIALFVVFIALLAWYSTSAFSQLERVGIRHPKPIPFIGNMLLFQKGFWEAHSMLMKTYGPICGYYMGRQMTILVAEPEAIKQVLVKDFSNFTNRMKRNIALKPMSDSILCLRDGRWKHVRSVLTPTFSALKMKEMSPLINQACDTLLKNLMVYADSGKEFDIQSFYGWFTMDVVASVAFGTQVDSQKNPNDPFVEHSKMFFQFSLFKPIIILVVAFPFIRPLMKILPNNRQSKISTFFVGVIKSLIALRDQQPPNERRQDFLQLMLDARNTIDTIDVDHFDIVNQADLLLQNEESSNKKTPLKKVQKILTEDEILGQAFIFLIAGYETTCNSLSFATYLLATNPRCQEKLLREVDEFTEKHVIPEYGTVQEMPYLDMVIAETLRMYPPAFRFSRETSKDCDVTGQCIPAGSLVEIPVGYIHYNPEHWPEPEKFIPERFTPEAKQKRSPFVYLPFGAGPRSCIGMRLALLELKITLVRVLQKYKFETCSRTQIPLLLKSETTLGPKNGVHIKIVTR